MERAPDTRDIDSIHDATACYTVAGEVETLLDALDWPRRGGLLVDPGCGSGNMVVAALGRLDLAAGDVGAPASRVMGMEFHAGAVAEARARVSGHLTDRGWSEGDAAAAARRVVLHHDFLLDACPVTADVVLANPPYMRRTRLPAIYRDAFDRATGEHARGDVLHAYLDRMAAMLAPGGIMAVVTSDRWLLNSGTATLRERLGKRFGVHGLRRLDSASAFHRPKTRARNTPPRVHAVSLLLAPGGTPLGRAPHAIDHVPDVDGVPLSALVDMRLAPYLGPHGIFTVDAGSGIDPSHLVPCIEPRDICPRTGAIGPTRRWAIVTGDDEPPAQVLEHLDRMLAAMPASARRKVRWLPPERFDHHLPLTREAVLVPRLAPELRAIAIPAGALPVNHSLVLVSGMGVADLKRILADPRVARQADALALRVEGGYRSYTASLLRQLSIPHDLIPDVELRKAA